MGLIMLDGPWKQSITKVATGSMTCAIVKKKKTATNHLTFRCQVTRDFWYCLGVPSTTNLDPHTPDHTLR
jgi:hypothetical protein